MPNTSKTLDYYIGWLMGISTILVTAKGILRALEQQGNKITPNELVDPGTLIEAWKRGLMDDPTLYDNLLKEGLSQDNVDIMKSVAASLVASGDLVTLLYRGSITADDFTDRMSKLGFSASDATLVSSVFEARLQSSDVITAEWRGLSSPGGTVDYSKDLADQGFTSDRIALLRQISLRIPQLNDFYQFASWNTDDDTFAAKFGLDAGQPSGFDASMTALGIPPDFAKKAWRSHWQVPSLFIIKTLEQSGALSDDDVKNMLSALQIPPYFVNAIAGALKKNLTEAQIQALYSQGKITDADLPTYLANIGYSAAAIPNVVTLMQTKAHDPAVARKAALASMASEIYGITVGNVLEGFKDGVLTQAQAQTYLIELGLPQDVIQLHFDIISYQLQKAQLKASITAVEEDFIAGTIDNNGAISELSNLGIAAGMQTHYIRLWTKQIKSNSKMPTKAELDAAVKKGLVGQTSYQEILGELGYDDDWINIFTYEAFPPAAGAEYPTALPILP